MVLTVRGFAACKFFSVIVVKIQLDLRCSLFQFRKLNEDVVWTVNLLNFSRSCGFVWIHRERKIADKTVIAQSKYVTIQNYFTKIHVWTEKKKLKKLTSTGSPFSLSIINHSANVKQFYQTDQSRAREVPDIHIRCSPAHVEMVVCLSAKFWEIFHVTIPKSYNKHLGRIFRDSNTINYHASQSVDFLRSQQIVNLKEYCLDCNYWG